MIIINSSFAWKFIAINRKRPGLETIISKLPRKETHFNPFMEAEWIMYIGKTLITLSFDLKVNLFV
jgi:hypothetical protein